MADSKSITLAARSDFPAKRVNFKIDAGSTYAQVKAAALKGLSLDSKESYNFVAAHYAQDVVEWAGVTDDDKAPVKEHATIYVIAPAHLKPERKRKAKEEKEEGDTTEMAKYKGFTPGNALEKLLKSTGAARSTALQYIDIFASEIVKSPAFNKLVPSVVTEIIKRDTINIDEIELFEAVIAWGKASVKEKKKEDAATLKGEVKDFLPHIRFPLLTTEQLAAKVTPAGVLESQHILELFTYIAKKGKDDEKEVKLPDKFPYSAKARSGRKLPLKQLMNMSYVNWAQNGFMFDIRAKKAVVIAGLSVCTRNGGTHPVSMWWRQGSCVGLGGSATGWNQTPAMINMTCTFVEQVPQKLPVELKIKLKAGESASIYLHTTDSNMGGLVSSGSHSSYDMWQEVITDEYMSVTNGPSHSTLWSGDMSYACTLIGGIHYYA